MISNEQQEKASQEQINILNAACDDLAKQIDWHGCRLSKDDWRHMICGTILGWRMIPGIDRGEGQRGFIMLSGSSKELTREQCTDAITQVFLIGDDPSTQGLNCKPVRWCASVCGARWIDSTYLDE